MLKSYGVGGWVVGGGGGLEQFSVSPRPLSFGFGNKGFGDKGLGPGLDNIGSPETHLDIYFLHAVARGRM